MGDQQHRKDTVQGILDQSGSKLSPQLRARIQHHLDRWDTTDVRTVFAKWPAAMRDQYRDSLTRCLALGQLIKHAIDVGAWVEAIVLSDSIAKVVLRLLYLGALQRKEDQPLDPTQFADFLRGKHSTRADVRRLVANLRKNKLLGDEQAALLRNMLDYRNKAVHGIAFGEVAYEDLKGRATDAFHAAQIAVLCAQAWLDSPRPLVHLLAPSQPMMFARLLGAVNAARINYRVFRSSGHSRAAAARCSWVIFRNALKTG